MKHLAVIVLLLLGACEMKHEERGFDLREQDEKEIVAFVERVHKNLASAYNGAIANTDSLMDQYYEQGTNYVTPWGWTEPIDSTKERLHRTALMMSDYNYRVENIHVKSYGDGAYAYFIFRQDYRVRGRLIEEYLPTTWILEKRDNQWKIVHVHRSTDFETMKQYIAMQRIGQQRK